jgi:protein gp37
MQKQHNPGTGLRGIEWTDFTWNPVGGCPHGCRWRMPDGTIAECYAETIAEGVAGSAYPHGFNHHYWRPRNLKEPGSVRTGSLIFVGSMTDLFAHRVPAEHVEALLETIRGTPRHAFQVLTKNAPRVLKFKGSIPPNLWVGVSSPPDFMFGRELTARNQVAHLKRSMEVLSEVRRETGNLVWMSAEPLSWDVAATLGMDHPLDWLVIGAASRGNRYYQPEAEHVRRLLRLMDSTETPVFFKGNLRPLHRDGGIGRWREDFPESYRDGRPIEAVARRATGARHLLVAGQAGSARREVVEGNVHDRG